MSLSEAPWRFIHFEGRVWALSHAEKTAAVPLFIRRRLLRRLQLRQCYLHGPGTL
jgi:hypothetical protein